jgi:hypothetical protein
VGKSLKIIPAALACAALFACGVTARAQDTGKKSTSDSDTFFTRKDDIASGAASMTYGTRLPVDFETKIGVDFGVTPPPDVPDLDKLVTRSTSNGNSGAAWASMALPPPPLGIVDGASLNAKLDGTQDQSKVGFGLSRKLPINGGLRMTLKNDYDVTNTLPASSSPGAQSVASGMTQSWETKRAVQFDLLRTDTSLSAGQQLSSSEDRWLASVNAEQKIYGPLSITGGVAETPTGILDRTIKAGFKTTW